VHGPAAAFNVYKDCILPPSLSILLFHPSLTLPVTWPARSYYMPIFPLPIATASVSLTIAEDPGNARFEARTLDSLDLLLDLRCLSVSVTVTHFPNHVALAEI